MKYDNIKLLNLEELDLDINYFDIIKENNIFYCLIKLNKTRDLICEYCNSRKITVHDYREDRIIRHGLYLDNELFIKYKPRRYKCKNCNKIFYENNPFSLKYNSITSYTKYKILDSLRNFHSTFTQVADQYKVTPMEVMNIFDSYVDCMRLNFSEVVCIDEFYKGKKSKQKYGCIFLDWNNNKIIDVLKTWHKFYLLRYLEKVSKDERNNVKYVIIDMYSTYKDVSKIRFPNAVIAVDSFHVISILNRAMIDIRVSIMKRYSKESSKLQYNDMYYYMLKKFHYFFVKDFDNIYSGKIKIGKINAKWDKHTILDYLLSIDVELTKCYELKELYREFNLTAEYDNNANEKLAELINLFRNSPFKEFRDFGKTLLNWKSEILNSFIHIKGRRLSNGPIEGMNSRIKTMMKNACGFKNEKRLRNRLMFSLNKNSSILANPKTKK